MEIFPQTDWERLPKELIKNKGIALLLGETDSGKSSLVRYLIKELLSKDIEVSLIDSDIGQSTLGLPGTISMRTFKAQLDIRDFKYERMSFIGVLNPAKQISSMIEETKRLATFARKRSEIILVDTTGLVSGELGKALKIGKINAIKPGHIIAVERKDELKHILTLIKDVSVHCIKASSMARIRSRESRVRYRKKKFDDYFNDPKTAEFTLDDVNFFYNGKSFYPTSGDFNQGTLIGLNHDKDTKALGILLELIDNSITFKSPIKSLRGINRIVFGGIVIE